MNEIFIGSAVFTGLVLILAFIVLAARATLLATGVARLSINGGQVFEAELGDTLLSALDQAGVRLPTSCGGMGTCGLCRVMVSGAGSDSILPVERIVLNDTEVAQGARLACQVVLRGDLDVSVSPALLVAKNWHCTVLESRNLSPLIKEIILALPAGENLEFPAGCYVIVVAPPYDLTYSEIQISPAYASDWERMGIRHLKIDSDSEQSRAYSLVNRPGETQRLILNIRLALPPAINPNVPPGVVSSYLFGLNAGDTVQVSGHYGDFFIQPSDREIVLIGGGVGMAPLYAHVYDQLTRAKSKRTISYWYGARQLKDLYYAQEMEALAHEHDNFSWHVALSDPAPEDDWRGAQGFVHEVILRDYLGSHPDPQNCEYYLCGPPMMIQAVDAMLEQLGVPRKNIFYDDFGA